MDLAGPKSKSSWSLPIDWLGSGVPGIEWSECKGDFLSVRIKYYGNGSLTLNHNCKIHEFSMQIIRGTNLLKRFLKVGRFVRHHMSCIFCDFGRGESQDLKK